MINHLLSQRNKYIRQYSGQLGKKYNAFGESAFDISNTNASYTKNLKK